MSEIEKIRELESKCTPGPWKFDHGNWDVETHAVNCRDPDVVPEPGYSNQIPPFRATICNFNHDMNPDGDKNPYQFSMFCHAEEDGSFIAASRQAIPLLLEKLDKCREALENCSDYDLCGSTERMRDQLRYINSQTADCLKEVFGSQPTHSKPNKDKV